MISLNSPNIKRKEIKYSSNALKSGWISSGKYIGLFENRIKKITKAKYAISCINGTSALQISLKVIGVKKDIEVIVPSVSFIASVNAFNPNIVKLIKKEQHIDMNILFRKLNKKKININAYPIYEPWLDIGTHVQYEVAKKKFEILK